jgi:hypothetical protein
VRTATTKWVKHIHCGSPFRKSENLLGKDPQGKAVQFTPRMHEVHLGPLEVKDIATMVSDSFRCESSAAVGLAHLLVQKCQGNPFFMVQALTNFHKDKLFWFEFDTSVFLAELSWSSSSPPMSAVHASTSPTQQPLHPRPSSGGCWKWDLEALWAADFGSNVVDLLRDNIEKLEDHLQAILKVASCLGNCFTLHRLSVVTARSLDGLAVDVWTLVELQLLLASGQMHEQWAALAADRDLSVQLEAVSRSQHTAERHHLPAAADVRPEGAAGDGRGDSGANRAVRTRVRTATHRRVVDDWPALRFVVDRR